MNWHSCEVALKLEARCGVEDLTCSNSKVRCRSSDVFDRENSCFVLRQCAVHSGPLKVRLFTAQSIMVRWKRGCTTEQSIMVRWKRGQKPGQNLKFSYLSFIFRLWTAATLAALAPQQSCDHKISGQDKRSPTYFLGATFFKQAIISR